MTIRYAQTKNTKDGTDGDACAYNCSLLADGVKGVSLFEARFPTRGEQMDYGQFAPWSCPLAWVEVYTNGAKNFFVKDGDNKTVGFILIRPMVKAVNYDVTCY